MAGIILQPNRNKMPRQHVSFTKTGAPIRRDFVKRPPVKRLRNEPKHVNGAGSNKMLIVLPFWDGDRGPANVLARLIADLEPEFSESADFLFVARFDTKPDEPTVEAVSRKFNVFTMISQKRMTGWPLGCNGTFFGSMEWIYHKMAARKIPHYKVIFNMGADACPLKKGWIEHLLHAWDLANSTQPIVMAGALLPAGGRDHINGDAALLSGNLDFMKWLATRAANMSVKAGWDWYLAPQFQQRGWMNFPFIKSVWNRTVEFSETDWFNETESAGTVFFHGQKGFSLLDMARQKLL